MTNKGFIRLLLICICANIFICWNEGHAAIRNSDIIFQDTIAQDTTGLIRDTTISNINDTIAKDSIQAKKEKHDIEDPVKYSAKDSLYFDLEKKTVHLYGEAKVVYENIELTADYIEFDMGNQTVYATGVEDSTGTLKGVPHFKEGGEEFDAHWLRYNFKTKKGFVYFVKTKQDEGTLIGDSTKRNPNGHIHLKGAKYSTCDLDHPHFYLRLTKAKAVPDDKIVTGPAYLVVADIPLPLFLPFGYFPNTKGLSSGLLLPTWGQERARGFNLKRAGYYFAVSDYFDGSLTGDIYSKGSWATYLNTNYKRRYRYSGHVDLRYNNNVTSEKGMPDYSVQKDFYIGWNHSQDSKASPNSNFSANVSISSSSYERNNTYSSNRLNNTKSSSISYSKRWANNPINISANLNHSQNNISNDVRMTAPSVAVTLSRPLNPFKNEENTGEPKWYENIQVRYSAQFENRIETKDSLFLTSRMFDNTKNGFKHSMPISTTFKITRFVNLTPNLSYDGVLFTRKMKIKNNASGGLDTTISHGPVYAHSLNPSVSLGYSPRLYGMYQFRNSSVKAIRHVMSPYASLNFTPDISSYVPNYYDTYKDKNGRNVRYSYFDGNIFSTPTPPPGKAASIGFGLRNNIEMKYKSDKDTSKEDKKIPILENLDLSGSYNLMADSFNLSNINLSAGTRLFQDKFDIQLGAVFDPYAQDMHGKRLKSFAINKNNKLAHLTSATINITTSFHSGESNEKTTSETVNPEIVDKEKVGRSNDFDNDYVNYDIPWSLSINYGWNYSNQYNATENRLRSSIVQTLSFSGDLSVTKKWKIGFTSGYDFTNKEISYTTFNLSRDLHCWDMRFDWIPFGEFQNYSFTISARGLLQDLKYDKRKDWRDY